MLGLKLSFMDLNEFEFLGVDKCPYKLPEDQWKDDPTEWPSLQYHDLYHYLIKNPSKLYYIYTLFFI